MMVDIATMPCGQYCVFPREGAPERYDGEYEAEPLFGPAEEDECIDWCYENEHRFRMRRRVALVPKKFIEELESFCDEWRKKLDKCAEMCGRRLESDVIYKASAAWKEQPTHYAYRGDFGGYAKLVRIGEETANADSLMMANQYLDFLNGAASAIWELGFTLTFDKDGKHKVFGTSPQWVTVDND